MKVVVVGSTGYGGAELIRLLQHHPFAEIGGLISSSQMGEDLGTVFPHLSHLSHTLREMDADEIRRMGDAVFFAAPPGVSSQWLPPLADRGMLCIDLAGDFRLDPASYEAWYGRPAPPKKWLDRTVYGLSEWKRESIASADLIANPGCYPTAALLLLVPLLQAGAVEPDTVILDAKSGVSGAGRSLKATTLFCEVNENLSPYKVGVHQHTPEIERYAEELSDCPIRVTFTPQLVPMNRGILVTAYARVRRGWNRSRLHQQMREVYRDAPFVRIRGEGVWPSTKQVQGSNFCDIGLHVDERTGLLVGMAVIDNLVKGAAGQAVQNLNLRMGWQETAGLEIAPLYP